MNKLILVSVVLLINVLFSVHHIYYFLVFSLEVWTHNCISSDKIRGVTYFHHFLLCADKLAKALPEIEEIAKLLPDFDKIGENFTFLKSLLSSGE